MNTKYIFGFVLSFLVLVVFPPSVHAETCPDITLTASPSSVIVGDVPQPIQIAIQRSPEFVTNPANPWGDYKNATISFPGSGLVNLSQSFVDLTGLAGEATYNWGFNVTTAGTYAFSVNSQNSTSNCDKTLSYTASPVVEPSLGVTITDLGETSANLDNQFVVTITNSGLGNAINTIIKVQSNVFDELQKTIQNLTAGTISTNTFALNPTQCINTQIQVDVLYNNEAGEAKTPITVTDTFSVNGSDLVVDQFTTNDPSVTEGNPITFTAVVNNTGKKTANGFNVTFYKNSVSSSNKIAEIVNTETIGLLERKTVSTTWSSSGTGTHTILAVAKSASGECNTTNSQTSASLTVNAAPSTGSGTTTDTTTGTSAVSIPALSPVSTLSPASTVAPTAQPVQNQEVQQLGTISAGESKTATFSNSDQLNIQQVLISVKNPVNGATVIVKKEAEKPASVTVPTGEVHSYLTISTNVENKDINNAKVTFKIEKAWLTSNSIDKSKVDLNRFTTQWDKLPTALLSEDGSFAYYVADTPGFSVFSITGEKVLSETTPPVTGGGGPSGLITGAESNIVILFVMAVAVVLIVFMYKRKR